MHIGDLRFDLKQIDAIIRDLDGPVERRSKRKIRADIETRKWNDTIYFKLDSSLGKNDVTLFISSSIVS